MDPSDPNKCRDLGSMEKYDALVQQLRRDDVHQTHPHLRLVNPFSHHDLRERWNNEFGDRLEALNERSKFASRRLLVFFDYWHLNGLKSDQIERDQGRETRITPWERIKPKLCNATGVDGWLWHNFVCFIKDTERSTTKVSEDALKYCMPYFQGLIEAQETELMAVTNLDVLNVLMSSYDMQTFNTFREAVFADEPVVLRKKFKTKIVALYHPGSNGQMNCKKAYRHFGLESPNRLDDLLVCDWCKRLRRAGALTHR